MKSRTTFGLRVKLQPRLDGGWQVTSPNLRGLILSHSDPVAMWIMIPIAAKHLIERNSWPPQ